MKSRYECLNRGLELIRLAEFDDAEHKLERTLMEVEALVERPHPSPDASLSDSEEETDYARAICLIAECHDYHGRKTEASVKIREYGDKAAGYLESISEVPPADRDFVKQLCWVILHSALSDFRFNRYSDALSRLTLCERKVTAFFPDSADGLKSRVWYSLGRLARQIENMELARDRYARAMEHEYKRLTRHTGPGTSDTERLRQHRMSSYIIGKCLGFGLGWLSLKSGQLHRARLTISAARTLLQTTNDPIHKGYIELLYASSLRASARRGDDRLEEARRILVELERGVFAAHERYGTRARVELARIYHLQARWLPAGSPELRGAIACARHQVDELLRAGGDEKDPVRIQVRVLRARTLLAEVNKKLDSATIPSMRKDAEAEAELASRYAEESGNVGLQSKALLTLAEIQIVANDLNRALSNVRKAMEAGKGNPLELAVGNLLLARIFARLPNLPKAKGHFDEWQTKYASTIENGFARELAVEVENEVFRTSALVISASEVGQVKYKALNDRLRKWLLQQAEKKLGDKFGELAHDEIGVSRQTVFNWRHELEYREPRKGDPGAEE